MGRTRFYRALHMEAQSGPSEVPALTPEPQEPWDERAERLHNLASQHGLRYLSRYPSEDPCGIGEAPFRWMNRKRRPELTNVIFGSYRGTEIVEFDFALFGVLLSGGESGGGPTSYSAIASCALGKITASAPRLTLKPWIDKGLLRRYVHIGGMRLGDPGFRRIFHVKTRDRPFARALLQPEIRDLLLRPTRDSRHFRPGEPTAVAVEIRDRWIGCSSPLLKPGHIVTLLLKPLTSIADRIPAAISAVSEPYRPLQ